MTMESKKHVVAVCGGLNWDMISVGLRLPHAGETYNAESFVQTPGGKGANTAIALHRLSHARPENDQRPRNNFEEQGFHDIEVHMVGSVGDDHFGKEMIKSLRDKHFVNTDAVTVQPEGHSAVAVTWVEKENGENRILVYPGANHKLPKTRFTDISGFGADKPDLVVSQLELHEFTVHQLLTTASQAGIDTILNPSPGLTLPRRIYSSVLHLILNEAEAATMTGRDPIEPDNILEYPWDDITDEFLSKGVKYVVITLGENGAFFSTKENQDNRQRGQRVEAVKVDDVQDSSGAGDTFVGAYAVQWLLAKQLGRAFDIKEAVQWACQAAARTIQQVGCQESIPWASDLKLSSFETPIQGQVQEHS